MIISLMPTMDRAYVMTVSRIIFVTILLHIPSLVVLSQWLHDQRLTNDADSSVISYCTQRSIAVDGNDVRVVWRDNRDRNREIYYKQSTDGGESWGPDVRLTHDSGMSGIPSIAMAEASVHVAWNENRDGDWEIYYKRSTDGGTTWGEDVRLSNDPALSNMASITASGTNVYVVWADKRDEIGQVYGKHSSDGGESWGEETKVTMSSTLAYSPSATASGDFVHLVWGDTRNGVPEVYYRQSTNMGMSWGPEVLLSDLSFSSQLPSIAMSGVNVHVVWTDFRDGNYEVYHKCSTDQGLTWGQNTRLTNSIDDSHYPVVSCSGTMVHVVWSDSRDGNYDIYYKRSTNTGETWEMETRISDNGATSSERPTVAISDSAVHVIWMDMRDGPNGELYYAKNPTGNVVTPTSIVPVAPIHHTLMQIHPNPVTARSTISYTVNTPSQVIITIHDMLGRLVSRVVDVYQAAGKYQVLYNASRLSPGVYHCRLASDGHVISTRMVVLR
ncbi:MAG: exo-alpha-sialidase [Bacteroidetes bacterium]|nr:exo-alpha-sialidase [Bacteroidota bacterium]